MQIFFFFLIREIADKSFRQIIENFGIGRLRVTPTHLKLFIFGIYIHRTAAVPLSTGTLP